MGGAVIPEREAVLAAIDRWEKAQAESDRTLAELLEFIGRFMPRALREHVIREHA